MGGDEGGEWGVWHSEAFGWENDTLGGSILGFCRIAVEAYIMGAWPFDCSKSDNGADYTYHRTWSGSHNGIKLDPIAFVLMIVLQCS